MNITWLETFIKFWKKTEINYRETFGFPIIVCDGVGLVQKNLLVQ